MVIRAETGSNGKQLKKVKKRSDRLACYRTSSAPATTSPSAAAA